ncbi:ANTAR domain-containing protein [Labedella phragmitis]|uniref:ANTAR domain-containing protein n=1 Tax=Labedella phragmitis TaxID=2498849 RepID=A0A444PX45_9MICO|nr:GAF and ANTAR domain-containing protein [Labedella phragmitis]RWZ52448.1 ANTAR domain-containing protein [Labedella phragmitis]
MTDLIRAESVRVFVQLADALRSGHDVIDIMDILVQATVELTEADQAAVVLADQDGGLHVAASSSERSIDVEEAQIGTEEGPCLDCIRSGELVEVEDVAASAHRWPVFAPVALEAGVGSAVAVPMALGGRTIGGMNVFINHPGRMSAAAITFIQAMTQVAMMSVVVRRENDREVDQLQRALDSRLLIEQAKGFIAFQKSTTVESAFAALRDHARRNQARLTDVARAVVEREITI